MKDRPLAILILFLSVYQKFVKFSSRAADIKCDTGCPFSDDVYNLTCTSSSTGNCNWMKGSTNVMACAAGGTCTRQEFGYTGYRISDKNYVLQIDSLKAATFYCKLGGDPQESCSVKVVTALPVGTIVATCASDVITCSGINDHGTPAVTLELRDGTDVLASTTTEISVTHSASAGKTYTCAVTGTGSKCLSATSVDVTCSITPPPPDDCLIILIVAIVVLIVCVIAVVACYFGNKKLFRTIAILGGVIMICTGIGCTISAFVVCQTDSPIGIAACVVSILDIAVGILTIIIRFLLFPLK